MKLDPKVLYSQFKNELEIHTDTSLELKRKKEGKKERKKERKRKKKKERRLPILKHEH